jgi:hypothetical protein
MHGSALGLDRLSQDRLLVFDEIASRAYRLIQDPDGLLDQLLFGSPRISL